MGVREFSRVEVTGSTPPGSWAVGRFDERHAPRKLLFGFMYEDAAIELAAFPQGGLIFCIASAGCTAIKLARHHQVVAVDINPVQLEYVSDRLKRGITRYGMAERILAFGRALAPLAGWSRSRLRAFVSLSNPEEQIIFWRRYLDNVRFRLGLDVLLSKLALRSVYSAELLDCLPPKFGAVLRKRMERCFARHSNRRNPYAQAMLLGEFEFLQADVSDRPIELVEADAAGFLEDQPSQSFDGFSLSNILDGASNSYAQRLFAAVKRAAAPGAVVVIRSFREPPVTSPTNQAAEDRSMIWGVVDVKPAAAGPQA